MHRFAPLAILAAILLTSVTACDPPPSQNTSNNGNNASNDGGSTARPKVAYVTNGISSFWVIAEAGCRAAEKEFDVDVEVRMPAADAAVANQQRQIEDLVTLGVDGMAVSPIDPDNQTSFLNEIAEKVTIITHDSDAPNTKRLAYIGMDNYVAGRMCGELVKEAMPEGGSIMIFVGRIEQLNAKLRRQGLIDELLDRSHDSSRFDKPGKELKGEKYTILGTRTDNFDFGAAKSQPEETIASYPDLGCMVGLFGYNPPYMLEALKDAGKLGTIKVVAFDEEGPTLQAIKDGTCYGTVVQNPYEYGYQSVKMLAALARGDKSVLPDGGFMNIEARKITKENVVPFWKRLNELTGEDGAAE